MLTNLSPVLIFPKTQTGKCQGLSEAATLLSLQPNSLTSVKTILLSLALCVSNPSRVGELVHAGQCLTVGLPSAKAITVKQNFLSEFHKCLISDVHF